MDELELAEEGMQKALKSLEYEFNMLRTGRPTVALLENIKVDYYGAETPITQLAAIKTDANMMSITPWDKGIANAVEKAIFASNIGVTPNNDGSGTIRLNFPQPTEERRKEIVKECKQVAERARVGVRGARKDIKGKLERAKKESEITEDDLKLYEEELQKLTDKYVKKVDEMLHAKEAEVMEI